MFRTVGVGIVILVAIIWLPLWVQLLLFVVAVVVVPYRLVLFVPAAFADALYAPGAISLTHLKYTIFVAILVILYWTLSTKTRMKELYAMEKK